MTALRLASLALLVACSGGDDANTSPPDSAASVTYHRDVRPVVAPAVECLHSGGRNELGAHMACAEPVLEGGSCASVFPGCGSVGTGL